MSRCRRFRLPRYPQSLARIAPDANVLSAVSPLDPVNEPAHEITNLRRLLSLDKNIGDKEISGLANRLGEALKRSGD